MTKDGILNDWNWQGGVLAILQLGDMILPDKHDEDSFGFLSNCPFANIGLPKIKEFLMISGYPVEEVVISDYADYILAVGKVNDIIDRAFTFGLVDKCSFPNSKAENIKLTCCFLTKEGIETALKIQEHRDNERRFTQQLNISDTLRKNSNRSVAISAAALTITIVALIFAFIRLERTDKILKMTERRLSLAELKVAGKDGKPVAALLKELVDKKAKYKEIK